MNPLLFAVLVCNIAATTVHAGEWYVSPTGKAENAGSKHSPWDIASTVGGKQPGVKSGDTIQLQTGTYRIDRKLENAQLPIILTGEPGKPIVIRGAVGERATIDGGLRVGLPASHLWIRDLEIMVSEPRLKEVNEKGEKSFGSKRPWGGIDVASGKEIKLINLIVHDCQQGIGFWKTVENSEVYGCIVYDNGWVSTARGSGHAIYAQNQPGSTKTISHCILTRGYSYLMHAFGSSRAPIADFLIEQNIAYNGGDFLVGSNGADRDIRVISNSLYSAQLQVGYNVSVPYTNENGVVRGNIVVGGVLEIARYASLINENNLVIEPKTTRPDRLIPVLLPNYYDSKRAHLAVYNLKSTRDAKTSTPGKEIVEIEANGFLKAGQQYRLMDPTDFFGKPVYRGRCGKKTFIVPVSGEFAAYVLFAE
jgi:hypothetical protein